MRYPSFVSKNTLRHHRSHAERGNDKMGAESEPRHQMPKCKLENEGHPL